MKRRLRNTRNKAIFGTQEAATLAAAGITAAATNAAALIGKRATESAAKANAEALSRSAQLNAEAIDKQNEVNREMTTRSIEANKEVNAENRQLQKDIQMTLQMMAGQENMNEAKRESKIVVRNGGSAKRKLSLRGGFNNQPFVVTDGGDAIPLGQTPEGFGLYELVGDNHEQYHKTRGKYKSGVGVKFLDGNVIEGEGNGNTNQGELVLTTPNDVMFISKHNIKGFNPAKAVDNGMHPLLAFNIQENLKDAYNISDDGKNKAKMGCRKLRLAGGISNIIDNANGFYNYPLSVDGSSLMSGAALSSTPVEKNTNNVAKNGKRIRLKAIDGAWAYPIAGGVNALFNIGGAAVTASGNKKAGRIMNRAYMNAGDILADAYGRLTGIDESIVDRDSYRSAHFLPVVRSARYNINPQITGINRAARQQALAVNNTTLSSAARLHRLGRIDADAAERRSQVYANQSNIEEQIAQSNAERLSEAAARNAELDMQANRDYLDARLDVAKYNADVKNQSILGVANSRASAITQGQGALAQGIASARQAWGTGLASVGQNLATGIQGYANYKFNEKMAKAYSTGENPFNTPDFRSNYVLPYEDDNKNIIGYGLNPLNTKRQNRLGRRYLRQNNYKYIKD